VKDEISSARTVLNSAGIEARIIGDAEQLPARVQETAAWFIRESATNILKHSCATWAEVSIEEHAVRVTNDGSRGSIGKLGGTRPIKQRALEFDGSIELHNPEGKFLAALTWKETP